MTEQELAEIEGRYKLNTESYEHPLDPKWRGRTKSLIEAYDKDTPALLAEVKRLQSVNQPELQTENKPAPIVLEGKLELYASSIGDYTKEWYELDDPATSPIQDALETIGKGNRVKITIEYP